MSQPHEIAVVPINISTAVSETIQLADVFGRVPVAEIKEVLNSAWAAECGWRIVEPNIAYARTIEVENTTVNLDVRIGELGQVTIQRHSSVETVMSDQESEARARQSRQMQSQTVAAKCNLAVNEVVGQALMKALRLTAKNTGVLVKEQIIQQQQGVVFEAVLEVQLAA